jgi:hypothetical protein
VSRATRVASVTIDSTAPKPPSLSGSIHPCNHGAMTNRCENRVPEALSGPLPPEQRARCTRTYDPSLGPHGGRCEAVKRAKNPETQKVFGQTKWEWYADRVPKLVEIHVNPISGPHARVIQSSGRRTGKSCDCPDQAMGSVYHVSPCRMQGLIR